MDFLEKVRLDTQRQRVRIACSKQEYMWIWAAFLNALVAREVLYALLEGALPELYTYTV